MRDMILKKFKNQEGVSLYLGIIMLSLIFAIALIISNLFLIRLQLSRDILNSVPSFYGADSALECAQLEITKRIIIDPEITCLSLKDYIMGSANGACKQIPMSNMVSPDSAGIIDATCNGSVLGSLRSAGSFKSTKRSTEVSF